MTYPLSPVSVPWPSIADPSAQSWAENVMSYLHELQKQVNSVAIEARRAGLSSLDLLYETTLAADAINHDAWISVDSWDEVVVQVVWKNAVAATVVLWIRPNNDATTNNYVASGGSGEEFVMGAGIAQNAIQRCQLRLVHPKADNTVREAVVDDAVSWTATTVTDAGGGGTWLWNDTTNPILSFRILTDNAGAALAAGTAIRIWGKRW